MKIKVVIFLSLIFALIFGTVTVFAADVPEINEQNTEEATTAPEGERSVFEEIYSFAKRNADGIMSALALGASIMLTVLFRNGLFPFLKTALKNITLSIEEIRKDAKEKSEGTRELSDVIDKRLGAAEDIFESLEERLEHAEEKMLEIEKLSGNTKCTNEVILLEVELLYEIFMSSSLPEYQKESVGEKISKIRKRIALESCDE